MFVSEYEYQLVVNEIYLCNIEQVNYW